MKNKIPLIGIANVVLYFLSVVLYLILKTKTALTLWELMTVLSGPLMLIVLLELGKNHYKDYLRIAIIAYDKEAKFYEHYGFVKSTDSTPMFITSLWT